MRKKWMAEALLEAEKAYAKAEIPIGCVAVKNDKVLARGHNLREINDDPTSHAEIVTIRKAAKKQGDWRLTGVVLYVTIKPCKMCREAIKEARIQKVYYGSAAGKKLLKKFFKKLR